MSKVEQLSLKMDKSEEMKTFMRLLQDFHHIVKDYAKDTQQSQG